MILHDYLERQQALDVSRSFIVQAPAGSGKTELLIQRFLALLNVVQSPEEILAITFTKKAANEMRMRVIHALKYACTHPEPEAAHHKQTWLLAKQVLQQDAKRHWHLLNNPNQLHIQTIDSFCSYLTRQLPMLSHFGSEPNVVDNPIDLYRETVQEVLSHLEEKFPWSAAVSQLLLHLDNDLNKLHDLLISLLAKRDQWLAYIHLITAPTATEVINIKIRQQLEQQLTHVISETINTVIKLIPHEMINELLACARFAAAQLTQNHSESEIVACRDLTTLPPTHEKRAWLGFAKLLLTKQFSWRKRVDAEMGFPALSTLKNSAEIALHHEYRQRLSALIEALSTHENLRVALIDVFFLPEAQYQDKQWEILQALLQILKITVAQLRVTFQQHGQIDFIENAQAALTALGSDENPTDLALTLDYQLRHILVDEFQDTSLTQYTLLEKLTTGWETQDGRTLFVVGDPMQSIYRFREAEVGLFMRLSKMGIGDITLTPLTLAVNFRATPTLVDWNNKHFQAIFPPSNDMNTGAVSYSPSLSLTMHESHFDSLVAVKGFTGVPAEERKNFFEGFINTDDQQQANQIVELIADIQHNHPQESIAILVRSRTHLTTLIPALKQAKLPYHAVDIDPLIERQCIQDLLALTRALLVVTDRVAWLSILRAPWCGLTLADLLIIAGEHSHTTIWERLETMHVIAQLSSDGQQRLAKILPVLRTKIAERERHDLRSWIESTWLLLGGPVCLPDYSDMEDVEAYFKLLEKLSLSNRTVNLNKLIENMSQLRAAAQHHGATLQIMTIHSAKGLEFDTVIIPHLERKPPHHDKTLLLWMDQPLSTQQTALLLAPIHAMGEAKDSIYEYILRQQKLKLDYETDRLLYVATTRAKMRLYLFFNSEETASGSFKIESGSFLEKLWPALAKYQQFTISSGSLPTNKALSTATPVYNTATQRPILRIPSAWENPIQDVCTPPLAYHHNQNGYKLTPQKPKLIGIVIHRVLQHIAQLGIAWWQTAKQQRQYLWQQLQQEGIQPVDMDSALQIAQQAIQNTLNDPRGQWILAAHHDAQSEFAITAKINNKIENLVIDRTFVAETGIRWIIDYKTTTFHQSDLDAFLKKEQKKYLEKMYSYAEALRLMDDRPLRLGLYFPALQAWNEWE